MRHPRLTPPRRSPGLQAVVARSQLTETDKQFAACLAAPPDFDAAGNLDPAMSLQRMASVGALQHSEFSPARTAAAAAQAQQQQLPGGGGGSSAVKPGELLRMPSVQQTKKDKKPDGWRSHDGVSPDPAGLTSEGSGVPQQLPAAAAETRGWPSVSTPEGRAELAALAREADRARQWQLFHGCRDAVAALVGTGYLLLQAAGFSRRAPAAVDGFSSGLRRLASLGAGGAAALGRVGSLGGVGGEGGGGQGGGPSLAGA
jgi:hypothetical protein